MSFRVRSDQGSALSLSGSLSASGSSKTTSIHSTLFCTIPLWVTEAGPVSVLFLFGSMSLGQHSVLSCTVPLWVTEVGPALCTVPVLVTETGPGLYAIRLWVRPDHYVHRTLYCSSLGQVGPLVSTARSALSRFEAGPQCPQHSVMFLSGSGRTIMSTARSALTLSGSLRLDRCTELHIAQWTDLLCSTAGA